MKKLKLGKVGKALSRKLGPLPVWAWALIAGAAIYVYRMRKSTGATAAAADPSATTNATPQDPLTLQPGESVYDPNTGQLSGAAPSPAIPQPQSPVTLEPGEKVYDPNTGQVLGGDQAPNTDTPATSNPSAATASKGKTKPRKSPSTKALLAELRGKHSAGHRAHVLKLLAQRHVKVPKKIAHPTTHKSKPRSSASVRGHGHSVKRQATHKGRTRAHPIPPRPVARKRAATPTHPVMRAHPHSKRKKR